MGNCIQSQGCGPGDGGKQRIGPVAGFAPVILELEPRLGMLSAGPPKSRCPLAAQTRRCCGLPFRSPVP
ncbi:unnamed protein product [Protopolystoma xenopodis]|uniref:Uncharacterized protein n=1 Tax=Protopolystoma xenopodis TaxID=117903 RepID=A0A448XIB5_9PLAT|nr:unnamed protein product [Protopolystoma xenopodis]